MSKCQSALISDTMLHLLLFESTSRFVAKGAQGLEDLKLSLSQLPGCNTHFSQKIADVFEIYLRKPPSIIEYSVLKAYIITSAESTVLSNNLNESLSLARENLSELLFKVIKFSRGKNSVTAANILSANLHFIYESRNLASCIRQSQQPFYIRESESKIPFHKILTDIINPEVSDLLLTTANCRKMSTQMAPSISTVPLTAPPPEPIPLFHFSPPSLSPHHIDAAPPPPQYTDYSMPSTSSYPSSSSPFQSSYRPNSLSSFPKIPLQMTKSIEEFLRPSGMTADEMNKPLEKNWADGFRLTPVFTKDIVSQFFPELSNINHNPPF